jgi:cytochrome c biogenesis protein CcmG/thiol:disulfide interchange protein DsbE
MVSTEMTHSKVDQVIKVAIGALLVALGFVVVYTMQEHIVEAGDRAPNFNVTTDDGRHITARDFGGKVLVLNFWASWCGPCVQEAPSLNEFARAFASSGVVVLGINVDRNKQQYQNFLKRFQIAFPTAWDPQEDINNRYGTYKFPESYIIGRDGKVAVKFMGLPEVGGVAKRWTDPEIVSQVKALL